MNDSEWFFLESGRQMGPVPLEQLVTLLRTRLPRGTLVWRDGMADWLKAEEVHDLVAALGTVAAPAAPPPPLAAPSPPPAAPSPMPAAASPLPAAPSPLPAAPSPGAPRVAPTGGPSPALRASSPTASTRPAYRPAASVSARVPARGNDEPYTLNPLTLWRRCFRFGGRFDRGQFAIAYLGSIVLAFFLFVMLGALAGASGSQGPSGASSAMIGLVFLILAPVMLVISIGSVVRRLHDMGQPGWYCLLMLVPCLGQIMVIYLLVAPGAALGAPAPAAGASAGVAGVIIAVVAVFGGIALIGIIAAIAIPSLLRARLSANEAATIGDIRTILSAQAAYQASNGGFYEKRLECLGRPADCLSNSTAPPFADAAALASPKSGYVRELVAGASGQDLPAGLSRSSVTSYAVVAHPVTVGQTGLRSFCGDSSGRLCYDPSGRANLVDQTSSEVMCSTTCQDLQ